MNPDVVELLVGAIGALATAVAAIYATRSSKRATTRRADAEAYVDAQKTYKDVIDQLKAELRRMETDLRAARHEMAETRTAMNDLQRQLGDCIAVMLSHGLPIPDRTAP